MRESNLKEGTARTRNTNDRWSGTDVDILAYSDVLTLRVRNFLSSNFDVPMEWKKELKLQLYQIALPEDADAQEKKELFKAIDLLTSEAVVGTGDDHIEEQIIEILDVAERLIKSMVIQYAEEHRELVEKYARYLIENPGNADVVTQSIKALPE